MSKIILPGIPSEPDPTAGIALPLMRGFPCPVATPFMDQGGPEEGIGCGWSSVAGHGLKFFVTIHAKGGFAMVAQLDYARYRRFAENYAGIGKQALLTGDLETRSENDPLAALAVAHEALEPFAREFEDAGAGHLPDDTPWNVANTDIEPGKGFDMIPTVSDFRRAHAAFATVAKALMIEPKDETDD